MSKRGFTLIEMLVVVTIIGVLVAIVAPRLGPAVQKQNVRSARDLIVTMHAKARDLPNSLVPTSRISFDTSSCTTVRRLDGITKASLQPLIRS